MKHFLKYFFALVLSVNCTAQDSIKAIYGVSVGSLGGINNSFMGFVDTNLRHPEGTYRPADYYAKWNPMYGCQTSFYGTYKKLKFKVGSSFLTYQSRFVNQVTTGEHGLGGYSDQTYTYFVKQSAQVLMFNGSIFAKWRYFNLGCGLSFNTEVKKKQKVMEQYESDWGYGTSTGQYTTGHSSTYGESQTWKQRPLYDYFSYSLLAEVPFLKSKWEATFKADFGPIINQCFLLVGINKKFKCLTVKRKDTI